MESITRSASLLFLSLTLANSAYVPCENCVNRATPTVLARMELRLYPNATMNEYASVPIGDATDLLDLMDDGKPTVLYIFGWTEDPDSDSVRAVVGAYLKRQDHNVMVINWQEIAAQLYPYSAYSVEGVGYTLAGAINALVAAGSNSLSSGLHIVGHSLGAQIAGAVGRSLEFGAARITGLDPAGPGYYTLIEGLTSLDAKFVDVIHTDAGVFGTANNDGTVNFHPNGGTSPQPGCILSGRLADSCSHARSWTYYAESLLNERAFVGVKCSSYLKFASGICRSNEEVIMGFAAPTTASGRVYLQTNKAAPYGRGNYGKSYNLVDSLINRLS